MVLFASLGRSFGGRDGACEDEYETGFLGFGDGCMRSFGCGWVEEGRIHIHT